MESAYMALLTENILSLIGPYYIFAYTLWKHAYYTSKPRSIKLDKRFNGF